MNDTTSSLIAAIEEIASQGYESCNLFVRLDDAIEIIRQHEAEAQQPSEDAVERVAQALHESFGCAEFPDNWTTMAKAAIAAYELRGVGLTDAKRQEEGETPAKEERVEVPITTPDTLNGYYGDVHKIACILDKHLPKDVPANRDDVHACALLIAGVPQEQQREIRVIKDDGLFKNCAGTHWPSTITAESYEEDGKKYVRLVNLLERESSNAVIILARVMAQAESDLKSAQAEIAKLNGLEPGTTEWPAWTPQANTLRWFKMLRQQFGITQIEGQ